MPPRLPTQSALRTLSNSSIRSFSSTAAVSVPRQDIFHPPHRNSSSSNTTSSSSNNLLSLHSNRNNNNSSSSPGNSSPSQAGESASRLLNHYRSFERDHHKNRAETTTRNKLAQLEYLRNQKNSNDYLKQMPRRWDAGDVYSPHDMSPVEMQKWRKRSPRRADVVDALGIRPLDMYKNFALVQEFTSTSGQITHSGGTSLRPVNQRKIAKMIRRVQGMGLYPTIHDHPEMIRDNFFPERR
ncbi:hypothetical protein PT974_05708 [Cladobotryum mycophilum]|uniref:Small ribosomal subunit protein bS18m n=1 Tax=Cladobotryum mycophilum TaxID=491253 RepID=A0ABR0SJH9_9HYPO